MNAPDRRVSHPLRPQLRQPTDLQVADMHRNNIISGVNCSHLCHFGLNWISILPDQHQAVASVSLTAWR